MDIQVTVLENFSFESYIGVPLGFIVFCIRKSHFIDRYRLGVNWIRTLVRCSWAALWR